MRFNLGEKSATLLAKHGVWPATDHRGVGNGRGVISIRHTSGVGITEVHYPRVSV